VAHVRTQIRARVRAAVTGLTTTGANVFVLRDGPYDADRLPNISVHPADAAEYLDGEQGHTYDGIEIRVCSVDTVVRMQGESDELDDDLDAASVEVEEAIKGDATLAAMTTGITLESTEHEYDDDSEKPVGMIRLTWAIRYAVAASDPETLL